MTFLNFAALHGSVIDSRRVQVQPSACLANNGNDDRAMAHPMFSPSQRSETFKLTRKISKTPASKSLTLSVKWPHPKSYKATPQTLSDAGFYWNPNQTAKDNVSCFFCNEDFSDWEEHYDPHVIHYDRCGESCAWAIARCGILAVDSDSRLK